MNFVWLLVIDIEKQTKQLPQLQTQGCIRLLLVHFIKHIWRGAPRMVWKILNVKIKDLGLF